jgi:hypothetical protein
VEKSSDEFEANLWKFRKPSYDAYIDHYSAVRNERAADHRRPSQGHPSLGF